MKIGEMMRTGIATCKPTDNLNRAVQLMWERRCGSIPVVDDGERVVGMLTDRDACMGAYTQGRRLDDIPVSSAMSHPARTCRPTDDVEDAEDAMTAHGVRRLVVVDGEARLRGIVSLDDIARGGAAWDGKGDIDLERVALTLGDIARRSQRGIDGDTPDEQVPETDLTELVRNSVAALKTLRDEIRVDLNLAGKELRDRWRRLETRLQAGEVHAHEARQEAARDLAALLAAASQFRQRLRAKARDERRSAN